MFKKTSTKLSVEVLEKCAPIIIVEKTALAKMKIYIDECADEIGWLGTATKEDGFFHITDVFLFDQEVHSTTTEITPEGLGDFGEELLKQEDGMEIWNNMKVWGHSHVNMSVTPSGQDDSQMAVFADNGHDFSIRIIANKKGDMAMDLYDYETGVIYKNIIWYANKSESEIAIEEEINRLEDAIEELQSFLKEDDTVRLDNIKEDIILEMKEKVRKKTYGVVTHGGKTTVYNSFTDKSKTYDEYVDKKIEGYKKKESVTKENEDDYAGYLSYNNETGEYSYTATGHVPNFDDHAIDEDTLIELAVSIDLEDAKETLQWSGYINYISDTDLVTLINNLKNDEYYSYYNFYNYGGGNVQ